MHRNSEGASSPVAEQQAVENAKKEKRGNTYLETYECVKINFENTIKNPMMVEHVIG